MAYVRLFPHYSHLDSLRELEDKVNDESSTAQVGELERMLFAPDPITGCPRSDIAAIMSKDLSPEIRDYINSTLMRAIPSSSAPDADTALAGIRDRRESVEAYADRLREFMETSKGLK